MASKGAGPALLFRRGQLSRGWGGSRVPRSRRLANVHVPRGWRGNLSSKWPGSLWAHWRKKVIS